MSAVAPTFLEPHVKNLGGFTVKRVLPSASHKMVGPFIFFDHMGPATFMPGQGVEVRAHPHIGLATVTYLFEGTILHRDSLGTVQPIHPGDVNWMTAGRGIAHSERTPEDLRATGSSLEGIQTWVALPDEHETTEPFFEHHPAATLPTIDEPGVAMRVIAGTAFGKASPARTFSDLFYVAVDMEPRSRIVIPDEYPERAVYAVSGEALLDGVPLEVNRMAVLPPSRPVVLEATTRTRLMLLGGKPLGDRFIWWNFVSSSREAISEAKERWRADRFGQVPNETDRIPLPDEPKSPESFS